MTEALKQDIGQILMAMADDFQRRLDRDLAARGVQGISMRHRAVFLHLGRHGAARSVDLANAAGIRPQSMMKIVHELEQLGLLERRPDPADSRAKRIDFTRSGNKLIKELGKSTETVWNQYAKLKGEQPLQELFTSLQALLLSSTRASL